MKTPDNAGKETGLAVDWIIRGGKVQGNQLPRTGSSGDRGPPEKGGRSAPGGERVGEAVRGEA